MSPFSGTARNSNALLAGTSNEGWKLTKKLEGQTFLDFFN
jgi:hypothetical protein